MIFIFSELSTIQSVAYYPKEITHIIFSVFTSTSFLTSKVLFSVFLVLRH